MRRTDVVRVRRELFQILRWQTNSLRHRMPQTPGNPMMLSTQSAVDSCCCAWGDAATAPRLRLLRKVKRLLRVTELYTICRWTCHVCPSSFQIAICSQRISCLSLLRSRMQGNPTGIPLTEQLQIASTERAVARGELQEISFGPNYNLL